MIILPLSHESGEVQRMPYVTIGFLILNVLIYIATALFAPGSREQIDEKGKAMFEYYLRHSYLEMPEEAWNQMPPEARQTLRQLQQMQGYIGLSGGAGKPEDSLELFDQQAELDRRVAEFQEAMADEFYRKYGYTPARGGIFSMFSSIFVHGGFLHLLFNMLFLWLTGPAIEDLWGRAIFPAFYILGGMAAALTHAISFPESHVPLVGASGAIAALMGAFMVRLYNTRIYFWYFFFFGFRMKSGTFHAPAYLMLPLWLVQQLFEAYKASVMSPGPGGGGVAFWAHIGGFAFGALVALAFKYTKVEEKYIAPALDRKTNLVDESYSEGSRKLREGDVDGAVMDLRRALLKNPDNPIARAELCRAYFMQNKEKVALLEFNRAIGRYLEKGDPDTAVDEFIDIADKFPNAVLETERQLEMARLLESRERFEEAADAYLRLYRRHEREPEAIPVAEAAPWLTRRADICLEHLKKYDQAAEAYRALLALDIERPDEIEKHLRTRLREAEALAGEAAEKALRQKAKKAAARASGPAGSAAGKPPAPPAPPAPKGPAIPLAKRIKPMGDPSAPPRYAVPSVAPELANKVRPAPGGLDLNRLNEPPVPYSSIYAICAFRLARQETALWADLFVAGRPRPFRIPSNKVAYDQFLPPGEADVLDKFRKFLLKVISAIDSVQVDAGTLRFLKERRIQEFPNQDEVAVFEKKFWRQIMGEARCRCDKCGEVYWIDGRKVPEAGARTRCKKCGGSVAVGRAV